MQRIRVISAGAARGLIDAVRSAVEERCGASLAVDYGPVGVVSQTLRSDAGYHVVITSTARLAELSADGLVTPGSDAVIGTVPTVVAARQGDRQPNLAGADDLRAALTAADAVYCPDVNRATAGIHLRGVLERLGVADRVLPRLRIHPHGAAALQAMAAAPDSSPLAVAQLTEVMATDGVVAVGALPPPFGLATEYRAAVAARGDDPGRAALLIGELCGPDRRDARRAAGFR